MQDGRGGRVGQDLDVSRLDYRLREMDRKARAGVYEKKKFQVVRILGG